MTYCVYLHVVEDCLNFEIRGYVFLKKPKSLCKYLGVLRKKCGNQSSEILFFGGPFLSNWLKVH